MKIVGLTGGIGSGKTVIASIFASMGIPVFNADLEAKKLYAREDVREKVKLLFGSSVYTHQGELNSPLLASLVFKDESALAKLNSIIHPLVAEEFKAWMKKQKSPYIIREAAILIESGSYKDCDHVILVSASEETRIGRVMRRSQMTREQVIERIAKQLPNEMIRPYADLLITNDTSDEVIPQIWNIHQKLKA